MKIHNIRFGFATNSSSSHSLILLGSNRLKDNYSGTEFGWENFTLVSKKAKRAYLGAEIYEMIRGKWDATEEQKDEAVEVARRISGSDEVTKNSYIDHDSIGLIGVPRKEGGAIDEEALKALFGVLFRDDVAILGGNDNDRIGHPALYLPGVTKCDIRVVNDPLGHTTIFNGNTGTKIRYTIEDGATIERSSKPELVDLKLTDYCPFDCEMCYQGSTKEGRHADFEVVKQVIDSLRELGTFEIAFGGGEPTLYPHFIDVLNYTKKLWITPNFTTKNINWFKSKENVDLIKGHYGKFAVSVDNVKELVELDKILARRLYHDQWNVQHVIGVDESPEAFRELVDWCVSNVVTLTLLGYKTTGRGSMFTPNPNPKWVEILKKVLDQEYTPRIGIDTLLVEQAYDALIKAGVPDWCMTKGEGNYSCYIDAVNGTIAPSSYCSPDKVLPLDPTPEGIQRDFLMFKQPLVER